jgi:3-dehydroquinate synthase
MMCAARLARNLGRVDDPFVQRQQALLEKLGLPVVVPKVDHEKLLASMQHDKKTHSGQLRFVLPTGLGRVEVVDGVASDDVRAALRG